jgi:hypothetical protein
MLHYGNKNDCARSSPHDGRRSRRSIPASILPVQGSAF